MDEFSPGQRWISHADGSLGLGIVTQANSRRVTLHFPAVEEERVYSTDNAPLTRLVLKPGDQLTLLDGQELTVRSIEQEEGIIYYLVDDQTDTCNRICEAELDASIKLTTPLDLLLNNQLGKCADFGLRSTTLQYGAIGDGFGLAGLLGARTSLLSHQLYVASIVGKRSSPRVLLADEVGLGKTIEAGLILNQQILRGTVQRVLILAPDSLTHQWLVEMLRRFHLSFSLLDEMRLKEIDFQIEFEQNSLVISPMSMFERNSALRDCVQSLEWDMVIIDEAHRLNGLGSTPSPFGCFIQQLTENAHGLLLLTATPEQAGLEAHFHRLQLIDPARFSDFDQFKSEHEQFSAWNSVIERISQGTKTSLPPGIDENEDKETKIQQILDRYGTGRILYRNSREAITGFPRRHLESYPLKPPMFYHNQSAQLYPEIQHAEDQWISQDPRVPWLVNHLKELRPSKVLVICAHSTTAMALEHQLHLKEGIRCAAFHESLSLIERDRASAYFSEEINGAQALICSEIGSEGRNFQFAQHLICFDLPRHPDLLEQRIGRLDRIGQESDIYIHVPIFINTSQEILFRWFENGLNAFTQTSAVGHQLYTEFHKKLEAALNKPKEDVEPLLTETKKRCHLLKMEVEAGRNKLLERNSHNASEGAFLKKNLERREKPSELSEYCNKLFDRIGIEQDDLEEDIVLLKPTERLFTGQLPGLNEGGISATYCRQKALSRDDLVFLSWEHPIIIESMQALLESDIGKASVGKFKHRGLPPGTVLLEGLFRIDCLAPRQLEVGQFLDQSPLRLLLTVDGRDVSDKLSSSFIDQALEGIAGSTSAAVLNKLRKTLEPIYPVLKQSAERTVTERKELALKRAQKTMGDELKRLRYLQSLNPLVRQDEINSLSEQSEACLAALAKAYPKMEGLRVCIAV